MARTIQNGLQFVQIELAWNHCMGLGMGHESSELLHVHACVHVHVHATYM